LRKLEHAMQPARVFIPQEALEAWLSSGKVHMVGETLFIEGQPFALEGAVRFMTEVTGGEVAYPLVGRVKTTKQVTDLGGESVSASVVLGDNAYEVIEGFLAGAEPSEPVRSHEQLIKLFAQR
jgi:hypothetical protein